MSRTFTLQDLQSLSLTELHALRGSLLREVASAAPHTARANEALSLLGVVNIAIRRRTPGGPRL